MGVPKYLKVTGSTAVLGLGVLLGAEIHESSVIVPQIAQARNDAENEVLRTRSIFHNTDEVLQAYRIAVARLEHERGQLDLIEKVDTGAAIVGGLAFGAGTYITVIFGTAAINASKREIIKD